MAEETTQNTAEKEVKSLPGGVTQDQVNAWKKAIAADNGKVYKIEVPSDHPADPPYTCYLRTPTRQTLGAVSGRISADPIKANEILLQNCWLGGDDVIRTRDDLFLSASAKLGDLFNIKEASIKEL
jgi:hypothetical protein